MEKYTVALYANFCRKIAIYHIDSKNEFEAQKKAVIRFITDNMNPNYRYRDLMLQQVIACKDIESLDVFIYNNVMSIAIQETPMNVPKLPFSKCARHSQRHTNNDVPF